MSEDRTPVERMLDRKLETEEIDPRLTRGSAQRQRSLEDYLKAGNPPRWMERLAQIDRGIANERRRLEREHRRLRAELAPSEFAARWRELVAAWRFDPELNELIHQHNEWDPIERQLPIDLRTRDYVLVHGRSYRRPRLDAAWALSQFPT